MITNVLSNMHTRAVFINITSSIAEMKEELLRDDIESVENDTDDNFEQTYQDLKFYLNAYGKERFLEAMTVVELLNIDYLGVTIRHLLAKGYTVTNKRLIHIWGEEYAKGNRVTKNSNAEA